MEQLNSLGREEVLNRLLEASTDYVTAEQQPFFQSLVQRFYSLDTQQDMRQNNWVDLLGATQSLWRFIQQRTGEASTIEVFNPDHHHHGWHSSHTIIRIIHKDMPFVLDSIRMKLNELGVTIHLMRNAVMSVSCDEQGLLQMVDNGEYLEEEAILYLEIDRCEDSDELALLQQQLKAILADVSLVVSDFKTIKTRVIQLIKDIQVRPAFRAEDEESKIFLEWLLDNNFTFLGYEELVVSGSGDQCKLQRPDDALLGLLRPSEDDSEGRLQLEPFIEHDFFHKTERLSFSKASLRSTVHRPAYPDFITIRWFDDQGQVEGEARIVGLYTSPVYRKTPYSIPYLRNKVQGIVDRSGLNTSSHHGKELIQILEVFPRDELFQTPEAALFETAMDILRVQERKQIKVFIRQDPYGPFCSALVYMPRDVYSTDLRQRTEKILCKHLHAEDSEFTTYFSESVLARVHFILKLKKRAEYDHDVIMHEVTAAALTWDDHLRTTTLETFGELKGNKLLKRFAGGFSAAYQEAFTPQSAVIDLRHFSKLDHQKTISMAFYRTMKNQHNQLHLKLYHFVQPLPLADQIPILKNLGLQVLGENPYLITYQSEQTIWIHDFLMRTDGVEIDLQSMLPTFQAAFEKVWFGEIENDEFNRLVLAAGLTWRQVVMLRAYSRYFRQIGVSFSQSYIAETLFNNVGLARLLVELFEVRFNPEMALSHTQRKARQQQIQQEILHDLDQVSVLSEDKIIRTYQNVIQSTLRTNFYQQGEGGQPKSYISFKISARNVIDIPKPTPLYEIFVYSPQVEGVHLRFGKVARGGLRWSDRIEDFRTEVLGLVKAQQVKNALIVPVGAKGGFVAKQMPDSADREEVMAEGVRCYQIFIRALLDITDNLLDGKVVHPHNVVMYDESDTYLVVAADKGTATFSDIANSIAAEYHFWLSDAFASGGSVGYDHKKMGITAKGAWVSVRRLFREMSVDVQKDRITAIGIGDMSGDVFGNGMLCSQTIALQAAFNHLDIFIDPNPDLAASYEERQRLFALPRSGWGDYDAKLISKGGGVFSRRAKFIKITPEIKACFEITEDELPPNELIRRLLRAPVDLLWNGGIGTYVKSSHQTHADVGDKANDPLRVNGKEVRAKVVGEGGNLGLSQLGRMEYAAAGGRLNTDFIDNSGGVDCSDHEVNIKILLNDVVSNGDMTLKQRNRLLESMTEEVSALVLLNNYRQTQAISMMEQTIVSQLDDYKRYMEHLEANGRLDRGIEFLPDNETLAERVVSGKGLTRPELSLLLSYAKAELKEALINSAVIEDSYLSDALRLAFPKILLEKYSDSVKRHRLRSEIIATQIANQLIDMMGVTFIFRAQHSTGASIAEIAQAFIVARDIFQVNHYWEMLESLDYQLPSQMQYETMAMLVKLVRRTAVWLIRIQRQDLVPAQCVAHYQPKVAHFMGCFVDELSVAECEELNAQKATLMSQNMPEALASMMAGQRYLSSALSVIHTADEANVSLDTAIRTFFTIGARLDLGWYYKVLTQLKATTHWQLLARDSAREELGRLQRKISVGIIGMLKEDVSVEAVIEAWLKEHHSLVVRWQTMLVDIRNASVADLAMFSVANRELMDLAQVSMHGSALE